MTRGRFGGGGGGGGGHVPLLPPLGSGTVIANFESVCMKYINI